MQAEGWAARRVALPPRACAPHTQAPGEAEVDEDLKVAKIAQLFTQLVSRAGMDIFASQLPGAGGAWAHKLELAFFLRSPLSVAGAEASPSRYETAPGSPRSAVAAPRPAAGAAPVVFSRGGRRGRGASAQQPTPAPPALQATPPPPVVRSSAEDARREAHIFSYQSPERQGAPPAATLAPPFFWVGPPAADGEEQEEEAPYEDCGGGDMDEGAPSEGKGALADPSDAAQSQGDAAPAPMRLAAAPMALPAPAATGDAAASSFHVQCGQGAAAERPSTRGGGGRVAAAKEQQQEEEEAPTSARRRRATTSKAKTPALPHTAAAFRTPAPRRGGGLALSLTPATGADGASGGAARRRPPRVAAEDWPCGRCTFVNPVTLNHCKMCAAQRGAALHSPPADAAGGTDHQPTPKPTRARDPTPAPRKRGSVGASPGRKRRKSDETAVEVECAALPSAALKHPHPAAAASTPGANKRAAAAAAAAAAVGGPPVGWEAARLWVITASGLDSSDKLALQALAAASGCTYVKCWSESVTHVVAKADGEARAPRTLKYMSALLTGQWVVSPAWVDACLSASRPVAEAQYELSGATGEHGGIGPSGVPAAARLRAAAQAPPLLQGLRVHLAGEFGAQGSGLGRAELEQLVVLAGGRVLRFAPSPPSPGKALDQDVRVVCEPTAGGRGGGRGRGAEATACATGLPVLSSLWLLDCVAHGAMLDTEAYRLS